MLLGMVLLGALSGRCGGRLVRRGCGVSREHRACQQDQTKNGDDLLEHRRSPKEVEFVTPRRTAWVGLRIMTEKLLTIERDESSHGHAERLELARATQLGQVDD